MRGVDVGEHRVTDPQLPHCARATGIQGQPRIAAIDPVVDPEGLESEGTRLALCRELHMLPEVADESRFAGAQFAPGDAPVMVGIHPDRELRVPNRELDRAVDLRPVYLRRHEA